MKIAYLNLAEEEGLTTKTIASLKKKYPDSEKTDLSRRHFGINSVVEVNLINLFLNGGLSIHLKQVISALCAEADKIMVSIHGHLGDTTNAYIGRFGQPSLRVNYLNLADFVVQFLFVKNTEYHVTLVMCYGARSGNFHKNHDYDLTEVEIKDSFAYRFYSELCRRIKVKMTARTGYLEFDEVTGRSLVQTEVGLAYEIEYDNLQAAPHTAEVNSEYQRLQNAVTCEKEGMMLSQMEQRVYEDIQSGRADWSGASHEERIIRDYLILQSRVTQLEQQKSNVQGKYGKIVYMFNKNTITVIRKYPKKVVLYKGNL